MYIYCMSSHVSPDTVSPVSTRFYLGVHAVRNIARTVHGDRSRSHTAESPAYKLPVFLLQLRNLLSVKMAVFEKMYRCCFTG